MSSAPPLSDTDLLAPQVRRLVGLPIRPELRELLEPADGWVISADTAQLLDGLVKLVRPRSVLEFGAGRSSLVLAAALQAIGGGRLTSIEHQPSYAQDAWQRMPQFTDVDATLVHAGLGLRFSSLGLLHQYTGIGRSLQTRGAFDFVLVDAPPGHLGRDATLLAAAPFLTEGAIVALDDASRPQERSAVRRWERALPIELVFQSEAVGRGIVVLKVLQPTAPRFSLRTFAGTLHDRWLEARFRRQRHG